MSTKEKKNKKKRRKKELIFDNQIEIILYNTHISLGFW